MSAIGILLMIAHHLFGFKEYLADGIYWDSMFLIGGIEVERIIAAFGKICVSLFAFNSGYVIWKFRLSYQNPWNCFKRCVSFLLSYWIVLAAFMLYAVAIGESMPTGSDLIYNLFGLSTGPDKPFVNIPFAWYVAYYITFISLAPIILLLFSKNSVTDCIIFALMGLVLWEFPISFMSPMMIGLEGLLFAKYAVFQHLAERLSSIRVSVILLIEFAIIILRQGYILLKLNYFNLMGGVDFLIVPSFAFFTIILLRKLRNGYMGKSLIFLSTCSMNLWFLHGIFFTGSRPLQTLIYTSQQPIIIYCTILAATIPVAFILHRFQKSVINLLRLK